MGLRTIHLKLHKPGKLKREILQKAFENYNNAFNYLLKNAFDNIDKIENDYKSPRGTYSTLSLSKWVDSDLSGELNKFNIQPFKDSLKLDFGMTMASYFVQKQINPDMTFPSFWQENQKGNEKQRPIYFCRYDTKRSFCLLYDKDSNRYFAKLFLMNTKNAKQRKVSADKRELTYISKNPEPAKCLKKETFVIFPLSFGKWQENMLKQAVEVPEMLRTAHLICRNNEYYLSISINLPEEEKVETKTFMGVSRGMQNAINYTIVDTQGNTIENGSLESPAGISDNKTAICIMANKITETALKSKSMVIVQNLVGKGDKLSWSEDGTLHKPVYGCKKYNDLVRVLEYKLPQKGLPAPAKVSSVDIFHRCSICGNNTRKNRFSETMFICTACGASYNMDELGSRNLAVKLIKYEKTTFKLKAKRTVDGMYLQNELIGLEIFVSKRENPYDRLKEEIKGLLEKKESTSANSKLDFKDISSILEKLVKRDFSNIEII
ncbi:MAG TPA: zinc ribbon domain-containing protein [Ruminiclostridium sp.]|nr:zinc ribbon domain-containing protein [Ruminiclostridium sp.]